MAKYAKQKEKDGKNGKLMVPGNRNETELIKTDVESDGEDGGATGDPKQQTYGNLDPNTDTSNDSIYSCTNAGRNINNGTKVSNMETKTITIND